MTIKNRLATGLLTCGTLAAGLTTAAHDSTAAAPLDVAASAPSSGAQGIMCYEYYKTHDYDDN